MLGEFDEVKRSCRKRLDGHNRRRRKPQPDPLNPAGLFANHHGVPRFASYPQIFSPTSMAEPKWPGGIAVKTEADAFHEQYYSFNGAASLFHHGKPERKHFPFLTDGGDATFGCQPPAFTITPSSESSSNSSRHSNGKTTMFAHDGGPDHNCALSLLSDNPAPAHIMNPAEAHHLGGGGGVTIQYGGGGGGKVARLHNNGDVSLTGLSYVSLGDKGAPMLLHTSNRSQHAAATATTAVTTSTAPAPTASQMQQYHGYYHHQHQVGADQGNHQDAGGMHALPFSSW